MIDSITRNAMQTKSFISAFSLFLTKLLPHSVERKVRSFRDRKLRIYRNVSLPGEIYHPRKHFSISLCTTCMNRLFHLRHTIEQNILDNISYPNIEFVLIDYNSQDGLSDFVKKNLSKYIEMGVLNYYKTDQPDKFHASKAKNLAHALAKGDIVCNVDGDNFTGKDFAFFLNDLYNKEGGRKIYQFHKAPYWGTVGRLAFWKEDFMKLGGYDESFLAIGHEDMDLVNRGRAAGLDLEVVEIENFQRYLSNTTREKSVNCSDELIDYYLLEKSNREISDSNIKKGLLKANALGMQSFELSKNFSSAKIQSGSIIDESNSRVG